MRYRVMGGFRQVSESVHGMGIAYVEPSRPLEANMTNNTTIEALSAQVSALTDIVAQLATVVTESASEPAKPAKAKSSKPKEPKADKKPTLTSARFKELKAAGVIPPLTTKAQAFAGVDATGKPLSKAAKEVIAKFVPPTGGMRQALHDKKVAAEAAVTPEVDDNAAMVAALVATGQFTEDEAKQILA